MEKKLRRGMLCLLLAVLLRLGADYRQYPRCREWDQTLQSVFSQIRTDVCNIPDREQNAAYLHQKAPVFTAILHDAVQTVQDLDLQALGEAVRQQAEKIFDRNP